MRVSRRPSLWTFGDSLRSFRLILFEFEAKPRNEIQTAKHATDSQRSAKTVYFGAYDCLSKAGPCTKSRRRVSLLFLCSPSPVGGGLGWGGKVPLVPLPFPSPNGSGEKNPHKSET